MPVTAGDGN
jgi:hypothetical protein